MQMHAPAIVATPSAAAELDRLGDQIAELSAHLDAATARLLDLIREFDARGGWHSGFRSCAPAPGWRVGLGLGSARGGVRVAPRPRERSAPGPGPGARGTVVRQGAGADAGGDSGDRGAPPHRRPGRHGRSRRADRARLAAGGQASRGTGERAAARGPRASRLPGRGRHGGGPGTARAGGRRPAPAGAGRGRRRLAAARGGAAGGRKRFREMPTMPSSRRTR